MEVFIKPQLSKKGDEEEDYEVHDINNENSVNSNDNRDNQTECFICLEKLELRGGRMILNPGCGHLMHMNCYLEYIKKCKNSCAICARNFPTWYI